MKQIFNMIFTLVIVFLLVWVALSYIDILCNNLDGAQYADWNLIIKMMGNFKIKLDKIKNLWYNKL